jgi:hypothetical protein
MAIPTLPFSLLVAITAEPSQRKPESRIRGGGIFVPYVPKTPLPLVSQPFLGYTSQLLSTFGGKKK